MSISAFKLPSFIVCGIAAFCFSSFASAQDTLTIGDKAPSLEIDHWLSDDNGYFNHTTKLDSNKIYVIEFWATWCGPCISAMPHLSELQSEYKEQNVQIISVSDESMETVKSFLERDVRGQSDKTYGQLTSNYCLTVDPDQSVYRDYFLEANKSGIPCAFIVGKSGVIEWIGHPLAMDEPLKQIVAGNWDRQFFLAEYNAGQQGDMNQVKLKKAMEQIGELVKNGKTEDALSEFDKLIKDDDYREYRTALRASRTQFLIMFTDGVEAVTALKDFAKANKENATALDQIAWLIYEKHQHGLDVQKNLIDAAINAAETAIELAPKNASALDTLAHLVYLHGNLDRAIELQQKAVNNAGPFKSEVEPFLLQLQREQNDSNKKPGSIDE